MKAIKEILLFIWQLPQNLLGIFILLLKTRSKRAYEFIINLEKVTVYYVAGFAGSGISLGKWIIIDKRLMTGSGSNSATTTVRHEHGHQKQSLYLGWLYLVVIGLPSLCGNIIDRIFHKKWTRARRIKWYYSQPWEKWADKLGGVKRWCQ